VTPESSAIAKVAKQPTLDAIFSPHSVAVVGATETEASVGRTILTNLLTSFKGPIFPINPKRATVLGIKAYADIRAVQQEISLAVIATPAPRVPDIISQCVEAGVGGAIVISAGFGELGPDGARLEREIANRAKGHMRVVGPNCLGVMNPAVGLNATFAGSMARAGKVAFLSQSGALCTAILDWSQREFVGFSAFVSTGAMIDVGWGDWIEYLGNDPSTKSILLYMESIGNARSFLSAARQVALTKPIIVIKAGRTEAAAKAAASHTGSLTGSDEVLDAAFRRVGVLRVKNIADLFYMADLLDKQPPPKGPRLTIVTNAGGPGVLATDSLMTSGGELATLSATTIEHLNGILPPHWSRSNPIDVLGDAGPQRFAKAIAAAVADDNSDGLLAILTPQAMTDPTATAGALVPYATSTGKPILASWMGGNSIQAGDEVLNRAGIPTFPYPDTAARAFMYMWRYTYALRGIYETPDQVVEVEGATAPVADMVDKALSEGRTLLNEVESKRLLRAYDIPSVRPVIAETADLAVAHAEAIGFPVVLKLFSRTITHKSDVGGVRLNLMSPEEVRAAFADIASVVSSKAGKEHFQGVTVQPMIRVKDGYEIIFGSSIDEQFGPVLLFGAGGQLVEIFKGRALALPPLNVTLARRMMEQTRIYRAMQGVRGRRAVDLRKIEQLLVRFSQLVIDQPRIKEIDINPLVAGPDEVVALDARVVLFPQSTATNALPRPAIRPYPRQYISHWEMHDGEGITFRPIRPEDEMMLKSFHEALSEQTVETRYFHLIKLNQRIAHDRLLRICFTDYDREIVLLAEKCESKSGQPEIVAIARISRECGADQGEFAITVSDAWQRRGLGTELTRRLLDVARLEGVRTVKAIMLPQNRNMQSIFEQLNFTIATASEADQVIAHIELLKSSPESDSSGNVSAAK
jgi:acetyltransferase